MIDVLDNLIGSASDLPDQTKTITKNIDQINSDLSAKLPASSENTASSIAFRYNSTSINPDGTTGAFEIIMEFSDGTKSILGYNGEHIWNNYYNGTSWHNDWIK
jgi:hypothetical protein